jgi:hypothetical protein
MCPSRFVAVTYWVTCGLMGRAAWRKHQLNQRRGPWLVVCGVVGLSLRRSDVKSHLLGDSSHSLTLAATRVVELGNRCVRFFRGVRRGHLLGDSGHSLTLAATHRLSTTDYRPLTTHY